MSVEKLTKNIPLLISVCTVVVGCLYGYNNLQFQVAQQNKDIASIQAEIAKDKEKLELVIENLKKQQIIIEKSDIEIKTKLSNIETTLIEIKQSLKK